ncbi:Mitochondrial import receptor subunit tom22, partial [Neolecta irregularis DAH-3]
TFVVRTPQNDNAPKQIVGGDIISKLYLVIDFCYFRPIHVYSLGSNRAFVGKFTPTPTLSLFTMVVLHDVTDESFVDAGHENDDDYTDVSSNEEESINDAVSEVDFNPSRETLAERITALKDMVSPSNRTRVQGAFSKSSVFASTAMVVISRTLWVLSTTALFLVPLALISEEERGFIEQEKEFQMQQNTTTENSTSAKDPMYGDK